jgi:hypothetical protein
MLFFFPFSPSLLATLALSCSTAASKAGRQRALFLFFEAVSAFFEALCVFFLKWYMRFFSLKKR